MTFPETIEEALLIEHIVERLQDEDIWDDMDLQIRSYYINTLKRWGLLN